MSTVELNKDLLIDAGGWPELKKARSLHEGGSVASARYEEGVLSGEVRVGGKMKTVRLLIRSRTDMENRCPCPAVRRDGRICAHVLALGLEVLNPRLAPPAAEAAEPAQAENSWPTLSEEGAESRLRVMLPLKIPPAWERGQLMCGFALEMAEGEEILLAQVSGAVRLRAEDEELWLTLQELFPAEPPGVTNLDRPAFLRLLAAARGHDGFLFGKKEGAEISPKPEKRPVLRSRGEKLALDLPGDGDLLVEGGEAWSLAGTRFSPLVLGLAAPWQPLLAGKALAVAPDELRHALGTLSPHFDIPEELWRALPETRTPEVILQLEGSLRHLEARPLFRYGAQETAGGRVQVLRDGDGTRFLSDLAAERAVIDELEEWGFSLGKNGAWVLSERDLILRCHAYAVPDWQGRWELRRGERFRAAAAQIIPVEAHFQEHGSGEDWLGLSLNFQAGGQSLSREEINRILQTGRREKAFGKGKIAVFDPERIAQLGELITDLDATQTSPGVFQVNRRLTAYLREASSAFGIQSPPWPEEKTADLSKRLGSLRKTLRPYQLEGVRWLWQLSELGMGGILADDMGLGKTLQTLAFLQARGGRALIVCPASLVDNWLAEAAKFTPGLRAVALRGSEREALREKEAEAEIWVTSYGLLRRDFAALRAEEFDSIVLDEAQAIKNPDSQVAKAAHALRGTHRIALTGTPLENSLADLWSIVRFVLPGYLGTRASFRERFEKPLAAGPDPSLAKRLSLKLKPILKRRLKKDVAKDLPPRIELIREVEPTKRQATIYQGILEESRRLVSTADPARRRVTALTSLLRLRQASCDPRLLPGIDAEEDAGAKLEELENLLEEAVAGGHRVLVFSQFVQLLQAVVPTLASRGWDYCYLDGGTRNRAEVVRRFQESEIPVFLISLKAGGTGLNLTAADTVIHLDPWWNPAVEAQATDRAHRIGQENVVTSYKLITKGSVEEKILALQERKKDLLAGALAEANFTNSGLSERELEDLITG
ncbi:MAG: DEAD/DEAH box helicase [Verrucomicrobiales bacterium]